MFDNSRPFQPARKLHYISEYLIQDFEKLEYDEIYDQLTTLLSPYNSILLNLGNIAVFRVRKFENAITDFKVEDILNPPSNYVKRFGRCNRVNQSIFYGAFDIVTALKEIDAKVGDHLCVGVFDLRPETEPYAQPTFVLGIPKEVPSGDEDMRVTSKITSQLLFTEFVKNVKMGDEFMYKTSSAISNYLLSDKYKDSIIYPSVRDYATWNIALEDSAVKKRLKFLVSFSLEVTKVGVDSFNVIEHMFFSLDKSSDLVKIVNKQERTLTFGSYIEGRNQNEIINNLLKEKLYVREK